MYENVWQHCCVAYNCTTFILLASTSALVKISACIPDVCLSLYTTGSRWFAHSLFTQVRMFSWSGDKRGNKLSERGIGCFSVLIAFSVFQREKVNKILLWLSFETFFRPVFCLAYMHLFISQNVLPFDFYEYLKIYIFQEDFSILQYKII